MDSNNSSVTTKTILSTLRVSMNSFNWSMSENVLTKLIIDRKRSDLSSIPKRITTKFSTFPSCRNGNGSGTTTRRKPLN
jgi:hypothetical protein